MKAVADSSRAGKGPAGFTLLEVIVAFIIAAIGIAALLQGASGGLQAAQAGAHYQEAVSRAQSRMALLQAELRAGEQQGDDGGGFTWRVVVQPGPSVAVPRAASPQAPQPTATNRSERTMLYAVAVSIAWTLDGGERQVTLNSQRLGTVAPEGP